MMPPSRRDIRGRYGHIQSFFRGTASAAFLAVAAVSTAAAQAPTNSVVGIYVDAPLFLPPPPANSSPQTIAELAELRDIAKSPSEVRLEKAKADDHTENVTIFSEVFSPTFDFKTVPATWDLFRAVLKAETKASGPPKKFFSSAPGRGLWIPPSPTALTPHRIRRIQVATPASDLPPE